MTDAILSEKKRPARRKRSPENTARKQAQEPAKKIAYIVSVDGTDEDIAARCAEVMPDWPTLGERARGDIVRLMRRFYEHNAPPRMEVKTNDAGVRELGPAEGANVTLHTLRLVQAMGTNCDAFANERLCELSKHFRGEDGRASSQLSAGLAFVAGAKAEDPVQSALAVQMVATHDAAMQALNRSTNAEYLDHAQMYGNLASKLLNAYTRQAETLAKLQRGGEQIIKHIHIDNRGGQAVVTDQVVTGGSNGESRDQPHANVAALLGPDAGGYGVPIAGNDGEEALSHARRGVAGGA